MMVTKKIRTEYMKKFKDPRWETFSKCYEDSLKYRVTRRVMEHSHRPWFWDGWDGGSDSSGWSTPRLSRNKILPLSLPPQPQPQPQPPASCAEVKQRSPEPASGPGAGPPADSSEVAVDGPAPSPVVENGVTDASGGGGSMAAAAAPDASAPSDDSPTDNGPVDSTSSDGEVAKPAPKRRQRRRTPRPETGPRDGSHDDGDKPAAAARKPQRAKSQPPISSKDTQRLWSRLDRTQTQEARRTNQNQTPDQARPESDQRAVRAERRRARSADLEKGRRPQLAAVVDERWMTEYMRCFSARLR